MFVSLSIRWLKFAPIKYINNPMVSFIVITHVCDTSLIIITVPTHSVISNEVVGC